MRNDFVAAATLFEGALSPDECARVRREARALPECAEVGVYPVPPRAVRRAATRVIGDDPSFDWVRARVLEKAREANDKFRFDVHDRMHPLLFVSYAKGGFFDWHTDLGNGDESTRKLSVSVQLSDPAEYEGGGLHLVCLHEPLRPAPAGTIIVFPAHLAHRVAPVTRGERLALVAWIHGPAFR